MPKDSLRNKRMKLKKAAVKDEKSKTIKNIRSVKSIPTTKSGV